MILMNSLLTMEERTLLQSLGCKDKAQAIKVLEELKMTLLVKSEMFAAVSGLSGKLKNILLMK